MTPRTQPADKPSTKARASKPDNKHRVAETERRASAGKQAPTAKRSKLDQIVDRLWQPEGASIAELMALTGWQAHSVRGALAGSLKRKGHAITSSKIEGVRRYRIGSEP